MEKHKTFVEKYAEEIKHFGTNINARFFILFFGITIYLYTYTFMCPKCF